MVGIEIGSVFGDEIRASRVVVPWTVWRVSSLSVACYLVSLIALWVALPMKAVGAVPGLLAATNAIVVGSGVAWVTALLGTLLCLSVVGSAAAWFAGASRMLWFASTEGRLLSSLSALHPRFHTPAVALVTQGILSSFVLLASFIESTVRQAYLLLLDLTVVLQMLPYLTMFVGLVKASLSLNSSRRCVQRTAGIIGALATSAAITGTFLPTRNFDSIHRQQMSVLVGCTLFLGAGASLYLYQDQSVKKRCEKAE